MLTTARRCPRWRAIGKTRTSEYDGLASEHVSTQVFLSPFHYLPNLWEEPVIASILLAIAVLLATSYGDRLGRLVRPGVATSHRERKLTTLQE